MRRGQRDNPNNHPGGIPIPGTGITILPNPDYNGYTPDNDISADPEICSELEQIPFSGLDCSGNGKQYFKYYVEKELCKECITKVLSPMNLPLSKICYKINNCDVPPIEKKVEPLPSPPFEFPNDPGQTSNIVIIEDVNNPFRGFDPNKTYYGNLNLRIVEHTNYNYEAIEWSYELVDYSTSRQSIINLEVSWKGKPVITFPTLTVYEDNNSNTPSYAITKNILLNGKNTLYGDYGYTALQWSANFQYYWTVRQQTAYYHNVKYIEATLSVYSLPKPPDPQNTNRTNREEPKMNCCTCADIRLMLERQKKDIYKYIDERKIDYTKILFMINQLGINLTQVNFDFSKQMREYNEVNFQGLAANFGIINQTVVDISNAILVNNNENTLFISQKIDSITAEIILENGKVIIDVRNMLQNSLIVLRNELISIITATSVTLEKNINKFTLNAINKVFLDLSEDIINLGATLTLHISNESNELFIGLSTEIVKLINNNINVAVKIIISEIRKNRQIVTNSLFNFSKNLNEYLAILLLQLSTEIKLAVGDIIAQLKFNPNVFTNLINNIIAGVGALVVPIINNTFDTKLNPIFNLITNNNQEFNNKFENFYNNISNNFNITNQVIQDIKNSCNNNSNNDSINFNLLLSAISALSSQFNNLESFLNLKLNNLDADFDLSSLELLIQNSNIDLKNTLTNEFRDKCSNFNSSIKNELSNLINQFNQTITNQLTTIINTLNDSRNNNLEITSISNQLQSLLNQFNQIQNFNSQINNNITTLNQNVQNSFTSVLNNLSQITNFLQQEFTRLSNEGKQNVVEIQGGTGINLKLVLETLLTLLALISGIDKIIRDNENCCDTITDIDNRSKEINNKLTDIEKEIKDSFPELKGTISAKCDTNNLNYNYEGKGFLGISQQILSVVEISKLLLNAICIESKGEFLLECEELEDKKIQKSYNGNALIGIREEIKAFADLQIKFNKYLCAKEDPCPTVIYPAEKDDHKPIKTQLQIYFGYNYPKATGTLTPLYIPNPRNGLTWDDFDNLIRNMGQEYCRIQWNENPLIGTGIWGANETHLEQLANKLIALSNESANLRFTKGGKRKRPIIERQLRAVRAVKSIMDDEGNIIETICYVPPKK